MNSVYVHIVFLFLFQLFINNEFVNSQSGKTFPSINPVTAKKICDLQEGDKVCNSGVSKYYYVT